MTGGERIDKLKVKELPMVVGYTGVKADTPTLVRQVAELKRKHPVKVERWFKEIEGITKEARRLLLSGEWQEVGRLMSENQIWLDELGVSSVELDQLIKAAREAGAEGAKLSGAGGGDCMISLVKEEKKQKVEKAIEKAGGEVLRVKLGAAGVRRER